MYIRVYNVEETGSAAGPNPGIKPILQIKTQRCFGKSSVLWLLRLQREVYRE